MNRDTSRHTNKKSGKNGKRDGGRMASESGHKMILIRSMMRRWVMAITGLVGGWYGPWECEQVG